MPTRLEERRGADINLRSDAQMREYEAIVARVAGDRPGRTLDWGAGAGQVTRLLLDAGVDVTAFDYSPDVEDDGPQPFSHHPELERYLSSDPVKLPFEDDSFDTVLSCGVLEHVELPEASLGELRRVLLEGGRLYVYKLPNRLSYLERVARRVGLYYHGRAPHDRLYDLDSARAIVEDSGFQVVELRLANMLPLTVGGRLPRAVVAVIWTLNKGLSRVPLLNRLATNVELVATAHP
jgi:ubiquinone/menaquinone biosynthesis C-methylase UbiE